MQVASERPEFSAGGDMPDIKLSVRQTFGIDTDLECRPSPNPTPTSPTSIRLSVAPASRRISSRSPPASTGPASASTSTATCRRIDLVGKDAIVLKDGKAGHRIPRRHPAVGAPATMSRSVRRIRRRPPGRDVRDPARARSPGRLTLLDQNRVIRPHPAFRLFATANTVGLGDTSGLYHGTQQINQGQMDRWSIVTTLNYLPHDAGSRDRAAKGQAYDNGRPRDHRQHGARRRPHRNAFMAGDLSTVMSPRTVITWAENAEIFGDIGFAFRLTFLNKCDELNARWSPNSTSAASAGIAGKRRERSDDLKPRKQEHVASRDLHREEAPGSRKFRRNRSSTGPHPHARHGAHPNWKSPFRHGPETSSARASAIGRLPEPPRVDAARRGDRPRPSDSAGVAARLPRRQGSSPHRRRGSRRAACSTPSSRRASRRSARAAWKASPQSRRDARRPLPGNYADVTDRADAPLEDALALMVREAPDGRNRSEERLAGGRHLAAVHRGTRRRSNSSKLSRRSRTSAPSARSCIPCSARSTWPTTPPPDSRRAGGFGRFRQGRERGRIRETSRKPAAKRSRWKKTADSDDDEMEDGETDSADAPTTGEFPEEGDVGDAEDAAGSRHGRRCTPSADRTTSRSPTSSTRIVQPRTSATPRNSRLRAYLDKRSQSFRRGRPLFANRLQRRLMAQQTARGTSTSRKAFSIRRACRAS